MDTLTPEQVRVQEILKNRENILKACTESAENLLKNEQLLEACYIFWNRYIKMFLVFVFPLTDDIKQKLHSLFFNPDNFNTSLKPVVQNMTNESLKTLYKDFLDYLHLFLGRLSTIKQMRKKNTSFLNAVVDAHGKIGRCMMCCGDPYDGGPDDKYLRPCLCQNFHQSCLAQYRINKQERGQDPDTCETCRTRYNISNLLPLTQSELENFINQSQYFDNEIYQQSMLYTQNRINLISTIDRMEPYLQIEKEIQSPRILIFRSLHQRCLKQEQILQQRIKNLQDLIDYFVPNSGIVRTLLNWISSSNPQDTSDAQQNQDLVNNLQNMKTNYTIVSEMIKTNINLSNSLLEDALKSGHDEVAWEPLTKKYDALYPTSNFSVFDYPEKKQYLETLKAGYSIKIADILRNGKENEFLKNLDTLNSNNIYEIKRSIKFLNKWWDYLPENIETWDITVSNLSHDIKNLNYEYVYSANEVISSKELTQRWIKNKVQYTIPGSIQVILEYTMNSKKLEHLVKETHAFFYVQTQVEYVKKLYELGFRG